MGALIVTIPHSGEQVPTEVTWLKGLNEATLMRDVDRFVDLLYVPFLKELQIPHVVTPWHRYVVDLNRLPEDIDVQSVEGSANPIGKFNRGFHWCVTTHNELLIKKPMSLELHHSLVQKYYEPFHQEIREKIALLRNNQKAIYHIDAHSMPSLGTSMHRDPGEQRADVVISDQNGKSCSSQFKECVIEAYKKAGFTTSYNWPYVGGRITEMYGNPAQNHHTIQVELNRKLYMNEETKKEKRELWGELTQKLKLAVSSVQKQVLQF